MEYRIYYDFLQNTLYLEEYDEYFDRKGDCLTNNDNRILSYDRNLNCYRDNDGNKYFIIDNSIYELQYVSRLNAYYLKEGDVYFATKGSKLTNGGNWVLSYDVNFDCFVDRDGNTFYVNYDEE